MGRALRTDVGGEVYHVINRGNNRAGIFKSKKDFIAFEEILAEGKEKHLMRIVAYCLMPNHWHLVLHPYQDGDLSRYLHWITLTHTQRYHAKERKIGYGHIYQGRYKSFLVETTEYFMQLVRYVERNPLRGKLVTHAEDWRWGSLWRRKYGGSEAQKLLAEWPVPEPDGYLGWVNEPLRNEDQILEEIRFSTNRGKPYGTESWIADMVKKFGLEITLRPRGRPKKGS